MRNGGLDPLPHGRGRAEGLWPEVRVRVLIVQKPPPRGGFFRYSSPRPNKVGLGLQFETETALLSYQKSQRVRAP